MDISELVHMNSIMKACKNSNGNMVGIPVFDSIQLYQGELYGKLIGYKDMIGNPIPVEVVKQIEKRMIVH